MKTNNGLLCNLLQNKRYQEQMDILVENGPTTSDSILDLYHPDIIEILVGRYILEAPYMRQTEFLTDSEFSSYLPVKISYYLQAQGEEKEILGKELLDFITTLAVSYHEEDLEEGLEEAKDRSRLQDLFDGPYSNKADVLDLLNPRSRM